MQDILPDGVSFWRWVGEYGVASVRPLIEICAMKSEPGSTRTDFNYLWFTVQWAGSSGTRQHGMPLCVSVGCGSSQGLRIICLGGRW